jgi:phenylacetate-CoA ligase
LTRLTQSAREASVVDARDLRDEGERLGHPDATPEDRDTAARAVAAAVKDGVGVSVAVEVVDPESLERSVGKIRRIVDLRPRG